IQIDTGDNNPAVYALFRETYTGTILAGNSDTYTFASSYSVPWNAHYDVRVNASLNCDSALAHNTSMIPECVDVKDLRIVSIDNPTTGTIDNIGSSIQVRATINNRSDGDIFNSVVIGFVVTNSQGIQTASGRETLPAIGSSATVNHTFNTTYTVPADSVYYLTVFLDSYENYPANDTIRIKRETNVGIETLEGNMFSLGQNIPNPATNSTRIDYSIPESGEVIFYVQSVSGQLLYSKTIEAASGINSLDFNTNTLAAGIYIYSIEYKGQRLIKRMSVQK
ncbi:MAG: T9SS type A sorting domain-containing protein, partial [Bacteroidales bacterium]|nr:T9SS type A sorting domain-containing protein [Bacteroidales bacterium]